MVDFVFRNYFSRKQRFAFSYFAFSFFAQTYFAILDKIFRANVFRANLILAKIYAIVTEYRIFDKLRSLPNTGAMEHKLGKYHARAQGWAKGKCQRLKK